MARPNSLLGRLTFIFGFSWLIDRKIRIVRGKNKNIVLRISAWRLMSFAAGASARFQERARRPKIKRNRRRALHAYPLALTRKTPQSLIPDCRLRAARSSSLTAPAQTQPVLFCIALAALGADPLRFYFAPHFRLQPTARLAPVHESRSSACSAEIGGSRGVPPCAISRSEIQASTRCRSLFTAPLVSAPLHQ